MSMKTTSLITIQRRRKLSRKKSSLVTSCQYIISLNTRQLWNMPPSSRGKSSEGLLYFFTMKRLNALMSTYPSPNKPKVVSWSPSKMISFSRTCHGIRSVPLLKWVKPSKPKKKIKLFRQPISLSLSLLLSFQAKLSSKRKKATLSALITLANAFSMRASCTQASHPTFMSATSLKHFFSDWLARKSVLKFSPSRTKTSSSTRKSWWTKRNSTTSTMNKKINWSDVSDVSETSCKAKSFSGVRTIRTRKKGFILLSEASFPSVKGIYQTNWCPLGRWEKATSLVNKIFKLLPTSITL